MSVSKEAIEAAKSAYWHEAHNGGGYSDKCYEAALTAALPFLSYPGKDGGQEVEEADRTGRAGEMTPQRAIYFLKRFKSDEKMLGPNEQSALDFAIAAISIQPVKPIAWIDPVSLEHLREVNLTTTNIFAHKHSDYVAVYTQTASTALVERLEQELARFKSDRAYTVGANDGWDACEEQNVEPLTKALEAIAKGETTVFDDDLQCGVEVSMDADEMSAVARAALCSAQSTSTEEEART